MLHGLSGGKQKLHQLLRLSWSQGPEGREKLPSSFSKLSQERSRSFRGERGRKQTAKRVILLEILPGTYR